MNEQIGLDFGSPETRVSRILKGLAYEEHIADPDADGRIEAEMSAEFPQYGGSTLRPLYRHWFVRNAHRQLCPTCVGGGPCAIDAIYTNSLQHALLKLSERTK